MKLLLDTHSFLWFIDGNPKLSATARTLIEDITNKRILSVASTWELAIKHSIGKIQFTQPFDTFLFDQLEHNSIDLLNITVAHTIRTASLPFHHRDPFDRILIAQSLTENIPIVSGDAIFDSYGVIRLWEPHHLP
jgi:PIN domain nuclease of toxin-antitoxin system